MRIERVRESGGLVIAIVVREQTLHLVLGVHRMVLIEVVEIVAVLLDRSIAVQVVHAIRIVKLVLLLLQFNSVSVVSPWTCVHASLDCGHTVRNSVRSTVFRELSKRKMCVVNKLGGNSGCEFERALKRRLASARSVDERVANESRPIHIFEVHTKKRVSRDDRRTIELLHIVAALLLIRRTRRCHSISTPPFGSLRLKDD